MMSARRRAQRFENLNLSLEEDQRDKYDATYDVHEPAVRDHPVAHLGHEPLCAAAEQQVEQHRERRDQGRRRDEWQRADQPEVVMLKVDADRQQDDEVAWEQQDQQESGLDRRLPVGALQRTQSPWSLDRLAVYVVLHRKKDQQADEQILDDVADRSRV